MGKGMGIVFYEANDFNEQETVMSDQTDESGVGITPVVSEALIILLSQNEIAFEGGNFDVAYHLLAASLHAAQATQDSEKLALISQTALSQANIIDADFREYHHSSESSKKRGNFNIFLSLSKQADTAYRMAESHNPKSEVT